MARGKRGELTQERLKELLNYDPETGVFTWRVNKCQAKAGDIAGCRNSNGHISITIDQNHYYGHQLAWLFVFGYIEKQIDHENRNAGDNRICNLRKPDVSDGKRKILTQEYVRKILDYDPEAGIFKWKITRSSNTPAGRIAGTKTNTGYRSIAIGNVHYQASHVAWVYVNGVYPKEMDHVNGDRMDDRICNLREATHQQNQCNRRKQSNNTSGFKGVSLDKSISEDGRKWRARISVAEKETIIGYFYTPEEANEAYCKAAEKYHGEFVRKAG